MPAYIATYDVEIVFENTGQYMNVEFDYEFYAEDEEEANMIADDYCQNFDDVSIIPTVENVEEA